LILPLTETPTPPNIVLILADDMGFCDVGCFGAEIHTPNLDALASGGLRLSQMYNAARCCPSRAALLTGLYPQQTGVGHMVRDLGRPQYQGFLNDECVTLAEVLGDHGYTTLMSGKWHVGGGYDLLDAASWKPGDNRHPLPTQRGFDHFYGLVAGSGNYFQPKPLLSDDRVIAIDDDDYYITDAISDRATRMLDDHVGAQAASPFFLHVTYTAPHWPLHARPNDIARYESVYRTGWDELRSSRHEELRSLGIVSSAWPLSPRDEGVAAWPDATHQDWDAYRMAVYAAQVASMDRGIGQILAKVRELGQEQNTLIVFVSDNGGCAEFLAEDSQRPEPSQYGATLADGRSVAVGNRHDRRPGAADTFMSCDIAWANVSNVPFRLFKTYLHEGGISTPCIISWPAAITAPGIVHQPAHFVDIAATCIDVAGAPYPRERRGHTIHPLEGESLLPLIEGRQWRRQTPMVWEHQGNRAVRVGQWKLVSEFGQPWELYDMQADRTELHDLAGHRPGKVRELQRAYAEWAERCGVGTWPLPGQSWEPRMRTSHSHYV
jgi:arylsulfatase